MQWQETKENLYAAFAGFTDGCIDLFADYAYSFQSLAFAVGCDDLECSLEEKIQIQQAFAISQSNQIAATDVFIQQTMGIDGNNATYQAFRSATSTTLEVASIAMGGYGLAKGAIGVVKATRVGLLEAKMAKGLVRQEVKAINSKLLPISDKPTKPLELPTQKNNVIHVTPNGVAIPGEQKYNIPSHYVENKNRVGSYGEIINNKFVERLRIDPATPPGMKGPNYSHYHLDGKSTHYSPLPGERDPGFNK